jgi:hypothetical protein
MSEALVSMIWEGDFLEGQPGSRSEGRESSVDGTHDFCGPENGERCDNHGVKSHRHIFYYYYYYYYYTLTKETQNRRSSY